jgi:predicted lactoylglutathione lyase
MNPKKIWANLGVSNLERTTKFYTELGFKPNGANNELTSFLFGDNSFVIHFFLKDVLQTNVQGVMVDPQNANEIVFTLGAANKQQVNDWAKEVEKAGGKLISQPEEFGKGYYGFIFTDPDGHRFNVFWMEGL